MRSYLWRAGIIALRLRIGMHRYWFGATLAATFLSIMGSIWLVGELGKEAGLWLMLPCSIVSTLMYFLWHQSIHRPDCALQHTAIVLRLKTLGIAFPHPKMTTDVIYLVNTLITDEQISAVDAVSLSAKTTASSAVRPRARL